MSSWRIFTVASSEANPIFYLNHDWNFLNPSKFLAPSGALVFIRQSCLYTFIIHFHFHSVFNIQNRTRQYFCMNYIDNACIYKFLQDSTIYKVLKISLRPNRCYIFKHDICIHLAHILSTPCTHLAHILRTSCTHLAPVSYTHLTLPTTPYV